ncbi:MAG: glycosyl hydrolase family 18 protein, partial [Flavitalea sp.]
MLKSISVKFSFIVTCLLISTIAFSQFRVVGYVPLGREAPDLSKISFQRLSHLNIAFVNPDSTGNLSVPQGFDMIIQKAHEYKVKVLASIGGGSHNPYYSRLLSDTNRKAFIGQFVQLVIDHNLDGLDVDIENDNIDKNYEPFIAGLAAALKPMSKLLTAALATWNGQLISDAALKNFDFINVMSYDQTGPWRPNQPGPHSTYAKAEEDLQYWTNTRGIPKEKLGLGVPFYGYCFGTTYGESMSYKNIIATFPGSDQLDEVAPEGGGMIYYNGLPTIKNKTALALKNAGGVMIWQLLHDAEGDKS